jgi:biopolymer transport protein ExbB
MRTCCRSSKAAGWPIWLIIITSIVALAIIGERFWSLRSSVVAPRDMLPATIREYQGKGVTQDLVNRLQRGPLIGRIFAAALVNDKSPARGHEGCGRGRGARRWASSSSASSPTLGSIATISDPARASSARSSA